MVSGVDSPHSTAAAGGASSRTHREEVARYSRHLIIPDLGVDGQKRLKNAPRAGDRSRRARLARAALPRRSRRRHHRHRRLRRRRRSNLQRQIIHGAADVGAPRRSPRRDSIAAINPLVEGPTARVAVRARLTPSDLFARVRPHPGRHRQLRHPLPGQRRRGVARQALRLGSIYRFEGQVSVFWERSGGQASTTAISTGATAAGMVPSCAKGGGWASSAPPSRR